MYGATTPQTVSVTTTTLNLKQEQLPTLTQILIQTR